jgi:hypothetical protein
VSDIKILLYLSLEKFRKGVSIAKRDIFPEASGWN